MPNWCSNRLTVTGPSASVRSLVELVKSEDGKQDFSFDKVIPCPPSLHATTAGSDEAHYQVKYGDWQTVTTYAGKEAPTGTREEFMAWWRSSPVTDAGYTRDNSKFDEIADRYRSNMETTGYMSWYPFCCDRWGTKWDASDVDMKTDVPSLVELLSESQSEKSDKSEVIYSFETAWSPPAPVVEELSSLFPDLKFRHDYIEEGCSFGGMILYENGGQAEGSVEESNSDAIYNISDWHSGYRPIDDDDTYDDEDEDMDDDVENEDGENKPDMEDDHEPT